MIFRTFLLASFLLAATFTFGQDNNIFGTSDLSNSGMSQLQANMGYKAANRKETKRIDGTPYLFENWTTATIVTKSGQNLQIKNVNFDGRRNKIVARINKDSIYTFNSLALEKAVINNKTFINVAAPDNAVIKVYEVIAETPEFKILKDHIVDINEGSSNPMRGTIYSRYIPRENYMILTNDGFEKFSLKKKKILKLLAAQENKIKEYVEEKDLSYKNEEDVNKIVTYYSGL